MPFEEWRKKYCFSNNFARFGNQILTCFLLCFKWLHFSAFLRLLGQEYLKFQLIALNFILLSANPLKFHRFCFFRGLGGWIWPNDCSGIGLWMSHKTGAFSYNALPHTFWSSWPSLSSTASKALCFPEWTPHLLSLFCALLSLFLFFLLQLSSSTSLFLFLFLSWTYFSASSAFRFSFPFCWQSGLGISVHRLLFLEWSLFSKPSASSGELFSHCKLCAAEDYLFWPSEALFRSSSRLSN